MRTQRFDTQIRYYDTSSHKDGCESQASRLGKTPSEWYREATREKLARDKGQRERNFKQSIRG